MNCPSCNKFASLDMQDPEVNEVSLNNADDIDQGPTVTYDVRIVRNSGCCGDEMKEYTFSDEADVPDEIIERMKQVRLENPEAEFEAEDGGTSPLEEGGGRYAKSYYGFEMEVTITHGGKTVGAFPVCDKVAASEMDELN